MEQVDIIMMLIIIGITFPFVLMVLAWVLNKHIYVKISRIFTVQEFKDEVWILRRYIKEGRAEDIIVRLLKRETGINRSIDFLRGSFTIILILISFLLAKQVIYSYAHVRIGYQIPHPFPNSEAFALIALSVWTSVYFSLRRMKALISMCLNKLEELTSDRDG